MGFFHSKCPEALLCRPQDPALPWVLLPLQMLLLWSPSVSFTILLCVCLVRKVFDVWVFVVLEGLKYAESHEWVKHEGGVATIGITDHAQVPPSSSLCPFCPFFFSVKILLFWCSALFKCLIIEIVAFCIFATHTRRFTEENYIAADYVHKRKTLLEQYFIFDWTYLSTQMKAHSFQIPHFSSLR